MFGAVKRNSWVPRWLCFQNSLGLEFKTCLIAATALAILVAPSALAAPTIAWVPTKLAEEIVAGNNKTLVVSFTTRTDINSATIRVVPALRPFLSVTPSALGPITKGSIVKLTIQMSAPEDSPPTEVDGTVQVWLSNGTLAQPLPINVRILGRFGAPSGVLIGPSGGVVAGSGGTSLTVPQGALTTDVPLLVGAIVQDNLPLSVTSDLTFVGGAFVDASGNTFNTPVEVAIPAPPRLSGSDQFLVATPINVQGQYRFSFVDIAEIVGGSLITQQVFGLPFPFPGITSGGNFAFLNPASAVGFVGGQVTRGGAPVAGAVITINSLPLFVGVTDIQGRYIIPAVVGSFTVTAFDPDTGAFASVNGTIPFLGGGVTVDIPLVPPTIKPGILVNGSFEQSSCVSLDGWEVVGSARAKSGLGTDPQGKTVINPTHKSCMTMISTGGLSVGGASSAIRQSFTIPSGITTLLFDYNFVTEEYPEFVGSIFNDAFRAVLRRSNGEEIQIAYEDVNSSVFVPVGGIDFPGGDSTTGMTGWRIAAFDVRSIAGTDELLTFSITDAGDTIYDSVILIDNVRLSQGALAFPFRFPVPELPGGLNLNPYTAGINTVFDHSRKLSDGSFGKAYKGNRAVVAYTGEEGALNTADPEQEFRHFAVELAGTKLYGFRNGNGTVFSVRGQYTGGCNAPNVDADWTGPDKQFGTADDSKQTLPCLSFLYYDGHPGYDYRTGEGVSVYPAAPGTISSVGCGMLEITHQDGYKTVYRHMTDQKEPGPVTIDTRIGKTGRVGTTRDGTCDTKLYAPHLHFEVYRNGVHVDPYGWEGFWGDPYYQDNSDRTSVNVWR